jgi:hypothetical protein
MTHLEDSIIDNGVEGARDTINYLRALRDMLSGSSKSSVNVTVKWDGAPAVFAGIDPSDGKFFVAKKGIFNKNPKIYKSNADIDEDIASGDLNDKMKLALKYFPKLGIKGVVQGDFLFSQSDLQTMDIDAKPHITFHPNTIVYAIPKKSRLGREIRSSKLGVVWHTTYRGDSFESMSASFGEEIASNLQTSADVFSVDAVYKDVSGSANFTESETKEITAILSQAGKTFRKIKRETFEGISKNATMNAKMNTFINSKIRDGEIPNPKKVAKEFLAYIEQIYQKEADKRKSEKGKSAQYAIRDELSSFFNSANAKEIESLFELYNLVVKAKLMIIEKLSKAQGMGTFLKTKDGLEATGQEGFVAIDRTGKNVVKLVDRLQFSKANFSPDYIKGWQK